MHQLGASHQLPLGGRPQLLWLVPLPGHCTRLWQAQDAISNPCSISTGSSCVLPMGSYAAAKAATCQQSGPAGSGPAAAAGQCGRAAVPQAETAPVRHPSAQSCCCVPRPPALLQFPQPPRWARPAARAVQAEPAPVRHPSALSCCIAAYASEACKAGTGALQAEPAPAHHRAPCH